ncbi:GNAT family N-acetyltransferase [Gillisia hiemivivida]|uniref:GNAT family N-acetyltransferase n=1 Tax=Gillisia hiemivivida TaxID=291190 RepID=A0A5C6ZT23_9FLAO|nr:GNAT family protein [Gillisia hiemivivida]TXD91904.1 GNAT family N-acetyltransferase [Gillisia hiemivivida]
MEFKNEIILENEIVLLRSLKKKDISLLKEFSLNEPELWKYSLIPANGLENLKNYIDKALRDRDLQTSYPFIILDKRTNKIAGSTRFYDYRKAHNTVQLGYTWYGKDFQGTGLNKNCKFLLLKYAFEIMNLDRVEFRADATNMKSIAAMKSIGCVEEGILRSNCMAPSGRRDSIVLSILKDEWVKTVKDALKNKCGFK